MRFLNIYTFCYGGGGATRLVFETELELEEAIGRVSYVIVMLIAYK